MFKNNKFRDPTALSGTQDDKSKRNWIKIALITICALVVLLIVSVGGAYYWYRQGLAPLDPGKIEKELITVKKGMSADQIALLLEDEDIIRSSTVFGLYASRSGVKGKLKAGTYELSPSMNVSDIVKKMVKGDIARRTVTILPARRLDQIREAFVAAGFSESEVDQAFEAGAKKHLSDILPAGADLEGYLYPETYIASLDAPVSSIVDLALLEFKEHLTDEIKAGIKQQGLSIHEAVILASIVDQESPDKEDQRQIAQVFLKRLREDISLGADPTFKYAAAIAGVPPRVNIDSPYNTRIYKGLPPGPIGNVRKQALAAVAYPAEGDFLFFVAGKDNVTRFSKTVQEHDALKKEHGVAGQD